MAVAESRADASTLLFERVQDLQSRLDRTPESPTRTLADQLVGAIMDLYGEGLRRILAGAGGAADSLIGDPLVATLLLIHDLHPVALEQRVQAALQSVRPYMESHGGDVQLLGISAEGVAHLHLRGSCSDCSASGVTLELAIKQALDEHAPDLAGIEVTGLEPQLGGPSVAPATNGAVASWLELEGLESLGEGELAGASVAERALVVANVDGTLLAFRDACAQCGGPLAAATLSEGVLACPGCGRAYFLPRAGRSIDAERLQLAPVPLLRERDQVKVALEL